MTISFSSANTKNISNVNGTDLNSNGVSVTAGQLVVYVGRWEAGGSSDAATVSVSDNLSSTWDTVRYERTASSEDSNIAVSWAIAASTGTMTVTGTLSAGREYRRSQLTIYDTSGVTLADNDIATSPTNSSTWTGGSVDYTDGDLTVCCLGNYNSSSDPGVASSGMTEGTSGTLVHTFYRVMSGSGTFSPVGDWASDDSYAVVSLLFTEGGASAFTLTAASGGYTYTGTAATLAAGKILTAASGSYAYTGTAAALSPGFNLAADSGAYAYSGTGATLTRAALLTADSGAYLYSGTNAGLLFGASLTADSGAYTYTGTAAALTFASAGNFTLTADNGSYSYSGTIAALTSDRVLVASSGAYAYTGTAVTLSPGFSLSVDSGTYAYSGTNIDFSKTSVLNAVSGNYVYNGTNVSLLYTPIGPDIPTADGLTVSGSFGNGVAFTASFGNGVAVKGKL